MTLPYDISRCAARYDFNPDGDWCPERNTCQRYLAFVYWDKEAGISDYQGIPVVMGMEDCGMKIEVSCELSYCPTILQSY